MLSNKVFLSKCVVMVFFIHGGIVDLAHWLIVLVMVESKCSSSMLHQAFRNLSGKWSRLFDFDGDFIVIFFTSGSGKAMNEKSFTWDVCIGSTFL